MLQLDPGLPDGQTTSCEDCQQQLCHSDSEHRGPPGVCPQPSAVLIPCSPTTAWLFNSIIKFADDTTIVCLITNNNKSAYREEVSELALWYQDKNLSLNVGKTKELIC
jgi:hypothetical protein